MKTDTVGGPGQRKRVDPHKWEKHEAYLCLGLGLGARILRTIEVNVCSACELWCEGAPDYIHDLPPCNFTMKEANGAH